MRNQVERRLNTQNDSSNQISDINRKVKNFSSLFFDNLKGVLI